MAHNGQWCHVMWANTHAARRRQSTHVTTPHASAHTHTLSLYRFNCRLLQKLRRPHGATVRAEKGAEHWRTKQKTVYCRVDFHSRCRWFVAVPARIAVTTCSHRIPFCIALACARRHKPPRPPPPVINARAVAASEISAHERTRNYAIAVALVWRPSACATSFSHANPFNWLEGFPFL